MELLEQLNQSKRSHETVENLLSSFGVLEEDVQGMIDLRNRASDAYYNDQHIMTDYDFDKLDRHLEDMGYERHIGTAYRTESTHRSKMLSLDKHNLSEDVYGDEAKQAVFGYLGTEDARFEWKADGIAVKVTIDGEVVTMVTRGDGFAGEDITAKFGSLVPKGLVSGEYNCELVMPYTNFKKYGDEYAHPRNLVAGIKNNTRLNDERVKDCVLLVHEIIKGGNVFDAKFNTIETDVFRNIEMFDASEPEKAFQRMHELRETLDIPTDGIVAKKNGIQPFEFKDRYPSHAYAIKFKAPDLISTVVDVEWKVQKTGRVTPIIIFEPVFVDGRKIVKCHGYNARFIRDNRISKGAIIRVELRGDIIPACTEVIKQAEDFVFTTPDKATFDGVNFISTDTERVTFINFVKGCSALGFKHLGESFFGKLAAVCEMDIIKIFDPEVANEETITPLGKANCKRFLEGLEYHKANMDLEKAIKMLSFDGISGKLAIQAARFHSGLESDFSHMVKKNVDSITQEDGVYLGILRYAVSELERFGITVHKLTESEETDTVKLVMTGSPKTAGFKTKGDFLSELGHGFVDNGNDVKTANFVVTDKPESKTGKMKDAIKHGVEIITYGQAIERFVK